MKGRLKLHPPKTKQTTREHDLLDAAPSTAGFSCTWDKTRTGRCTGWSRSPAGTAQSTMAVCDARQARSTGCSWCAWWRRRVPCSSPSSHLCASSTSSSPAPVSRSSPRWAPAVTWLAEGHPAKPTQDCLPHCHSPMYLWPERQNKQTHKQTSQCAVGQAVFKIVGKLQSPGSPGGFTAQEICLLKMAKPHFFFIF